VSRSGAWSLTLATIAAASGLAGCEKSPAAPTPAASVMARESLTAVDGAALPCCGVDSAGIHISIVRGALTFYRATFYPDSVGTPAGWRPYACVHGVPSGAFVHSNGLVTLPDGSSYFIPGCSSGTYSVTLSQQVDYPSGATQTNNSQCPPARSTGNATR
jgi:hypothetical protein